MGWRDYLDQIPVEKVEKVEKEKVQDSHIPLVSHIPRAAESGDEPYLYEARAAQLEGYECKECTHLDQRCERVPGTRRIFFWRCAKGHEILEAGFKGERVWIAPPDCHDYADRKPPGTTH